MNIIPIKEQVQGEFQYRRNLSFQKSSIPVIFVCNKTTKHNFQNVPIKLNLEGVP